jgi:hypothetical protein
MSGANHVPHDRWGYPPLAERQPSRPDLTYKTPLTISPRNSLLIQTLLNLKLVINFIHRRDVEDA